MEKRNIRSLIGRAKTLQTIIRTRIRNINVQRKDVHDAMERIEMACKWMDKMSSEVAPTDYMFILIKGEVVLTHKFEGFDNYRPESRREAYIAVKEALDKLIEDWAKSMPSRMFISNRGTHTRNHVHTLLTECSFFLDKFLDSV